MATLTSTEVLIGVGALTVAVVSIYLFMRASGGNERKTGKSEEVSQPQRIGTLRSSSVIMRSSKIEFPKVDHYLELHDVEKSRSKLRTLTLKRELLTLVLRRLFEAEDEGEITRDERIRLSKDYEAEMKQISEDLRNAELMVTLHELESIRDDIMKKFESTLNQTQEKIDGILKELKISEPKQPAIKVPREPVKTETEEKVETEEEEESDVEVEEKEERLRPRRRRSEVEEKLDQLRKEVLKELEELERLEIEV